MAYDNTQPFHWHYTEFDDRNFEIRGRTLFFVAVLFSVVLLTLLLFLCARRVCHVRGLSAAETTSTPHQAHSLPHPTQGLDKATINSFPIKLHRSSASTNVSESDCSICLGVFQDGEKVKILPACHHGYHSDCVDKWLSAQSSCPLCRSSLRAYSPV